MMLCRTCGQDRPYVSPCGDCYSADARGERTLGTGCLGSREESDRVRLNALAEAMACPRDEVNPHTLAAAAGVLPSHWNEVTAEAINAKRAEVRAAVAEARSKKP